MPVRHRLSVPSDRTPTWLHGQFRYVHMMFPRLRGAVENIGGSGPIRTPDRRSGLRLLKKRNVSTADSVTPAGPGNHGLL